MSFTPPPPTVSRYTPDPEIERHAARAQDNATLPTLKIKAFIAPPLLPPLAPQEVQILPGALRYHHFIVPIGAFAQAEWCASLRACGECASGTCFFVAWDRESMFNGVYACLAAGEFGSYKYAGSAQFVSEVVLGPGNVLCRWERAGGGRCGEPVGGPGGIFFSPLGIFF